MSITNRWQTFPAKKRRLQPEDDNTAEAQYYREKYGCIARKFRLGKQMSFRAVILVFPRIAVAVTLLWGVLHPTASQAAASSQMARANEILFIFNHGSSKSDGSDCYGSIFNRIPRWVRALDGSVIDGMRVRVEAPCTGRETYTFPDPKGCGDVWVCKRANLIVEEIKDAQRRGYPPERIFVGGHSAGGWASLLIKRWQPGLFNGVIATAPAFNGTRKSRLCDSPRCKKERNHKEEFGKYWKSHMRTQHDTRLGLGASNPPKLDALVISFPCDPYGWPSELPFTGNRSVKSVTFPRALSGNLACARPTNKHRHTQGPDRYTERCKDPVQITGSKPLCGSGDKKDNTYAEVLNCPPELRHLCALNQHTKVHRGSKFRDYIETSGLVRNFMFERIKNWEAPGKIITTGSPCSFIKYDSVCRRK